MSGRTEEDHAKCQSLFSEIRSRNLQNMKQSSDDSEASVREQVTWSLVTTCLSLNVIPNQGHLALSVGNAHITVGRVSEL